ncbi:MAG: hypothetical protein JW384_00507 [Nitrosomonadaceae bacterium]|nr:hypothetical protein [Nitrosomonadaceae bacterium]
MSQSSFFLAIGLLRRYLQMYWLKPFDAVNDAANAWSLRQFSWEEPILEIGGGDGVFSFIMHGGEFILTDDRYDQSNIDRPGDIFDVYHHKSCLTIKRSALRSYRASIDLKWSHLLKCRETKLYRSLLLAPPAPLPFAAASFKTVFLYFPHGLVERGEALDYEHVLKEIRRIIRPDGALLMTAVNRKISSHFVCYPLYQFFSKQGWQQFAGYFKRLDAGRYEEISKLGRSLEEWAKLLQDAGFNLVDRWVQVKPVAWRVYDFQTRPLLRPLIRFNRFLKRIHLKRVAKTAWVYMWLPWLTLFYLFFAKPKSPSGRSAEVEGVFFVFRAIPVR